MRVKQPSPASELLMRVGARDGNEWRPVLRYFRLLLSKVKVNALLRSRSARFQSRDVEKGVGVRGFGQLTQCKVALLPYQNYPWDVLANEV